MKKHDIAPILNAHGRHTERTKRLAVAYYVALGSIAETSRQTGIGRAVLQQWTKQDWWHEYLLHAREHASDRTDAQQTQILDAAYDQLLDKIQNGDYKICKGELVRVPMEGKNLAIVAATTFNQRQLVRNLPTNIKKDSAAQLTRLADSLKTLLSKSRAQEPIDITPSAERVTPSNKTDDET